MSPWVDEHPEVPKSGIVCFFGEKHLCPITTIMRFRARISFTERARRAHRGESPCSEEEGEPEQAEEEEEEEDAIEDPTPAQGGAVPERGDLSLRLPMLPNGSGPGSAGNLGWRTRWASFG